MTKENKIFIKSIISLWLITGPLFLLSFKTISSQELIFSMLPLFLFFSYALHRFGLHWPQFKKIFLSLLLLSFLMATPNSQRNNLFASHLGHNILVSIPPQSTLWNPHKTSYASLLYLQKTKKDRSDISIIPYEENKSISLENLSQIYSPAFLLSQPPKDVVLKGLLSTNRRKSLFAASPTELPQFKNNGEFTKPHQYPRDLLPFGILYRYFPAHSFKLVSPKTQLPLAAFTFSFYSDFRNKYSHLLQNDHLLSQTSEYSKGYRILGEKFNEYDFVQESKESLLNSIILDPSNIKSHILLGQMFYDEGDGNKAASFFLKALRFSPQSFDLTFRLGLSYIMSGEERKAINVLGKGVQLNPSNELIRYELANLLEKKGFYKRALLHWEILRDQNNDNKDYHWHLTHTYTTLNKTEKALESIREYLLLPLTPEEKKQAEDFWFKLLKKSKES